MARSVEVGKWVAISSWLIIVAIETLHPLMVYMYGKQMLSCPSCLNGVTGLQP